MRRSVITTVVVVFAMLMCNSLFAADIYMKMKQHTDAFEMMGQKQPAQDLVQEVWMGVDKISTSDGETGSIVLLDKGVIYIINHKEKSYFEMPTDMSELAPDAGEREMAEMQGMMQGMMKVNITVTPTNEKKKINKWNCTKYIQKVESFMGPMTMEVWASEEIRIDPDLYANYASSLFRQMPGMQNYLEDIQKEMKKIKGVGVLTVTDMQIMGQSMKSSTELLEVKEGKAPADAFTVPKGYTKKKMEGMRY